MREVMDDEADRFRTVMPRPAGLALKQRRPKLLSKSLQGKCGFTFV
jgi:hypothetical protein